MLLSCLSLILNYGGWFGRCVGEKYWHIMLYPIIPSQNLQLQINVIYYKRSWRRFKGNGNAEDFIKRKENS